MEGAHCSLDPRGHSVLGTSWVGHGVIVVWLWCSGRVCWGSWAQIWEQSPAEGRLPMECTHRGHSWAPTQRTFVISAQRLETSVFFHANFKLVRCFSWAVYRLVDFSKAQRDFFCRTSLRTQGDSPGAQAFHWVYSKAQLTEEGESCTLNAASHLGLTTLMWGNCSKISDKGLYLYGCVWGWGQRDSSTPKSVPFEN